MSASSVAPVIAHDEVVVVAAWVALMGASSNYPKLQVAGREGKWLAWARPMGSSSPGAVAQRARNLAKLAAVRDFQAVLAAHMAHTGGSKEADDVCLKALYPAIQAAQALYLDRDSDSD